MRISQSIFAKLIYLTVSLVVTGIAYSQTVDRDDRFPNLVEQRAAKQWITDSAFKADIKFLADDLLEGRGPGTRGDELAQRYIISQFEQVGLQPGSADGSWVQKVPLFELGDNVALRQFITSGSGPPSFQQIVRQKLDISLECTIGDPLLGSPLLHQIWKTIIPVDRLTVCNTSHHKGYGQVNQFCKN